MKRKSGIIYLSTELFVHSHMELYEDKSIVVTITTMKADIFLKHFTYGNLHQNDNMRSVVNTHYKSMLLF